MPYLARLERSWGDLEKVSPEPSLIVEVLVQDYHDNTVPFKVFLFFFIKQSNFFLSILYCLPIQLLKMMTELNVLFLNMHTLA